MSFEIFAIYSHKAEQTDRFVGLWIRISNILEDMFMNFEFLGQKNLKCMFIIVVLD